MVQKSCFISMVTSCKTIDKRVAPFTSFYCIHYQKTHRDTFCALRFLLLMSPTPFTIFSLYSNLFPRRSNQVSVHSISSSSSWISRWLLRDILSAAQKEHTRWILNLYVHGTVTQHIRYLSLIMISIDVSYTVGIYVYIPVYLRHLVSMAI